MHSENGKAFWQIQKNQEDPITDEFNFQGFLTDRPVARVEVSGGLTLPLPQVDKYASVRITVGVIMPTYPENIDATYEFSKNWVNGKLEEIRQNLVG